ncbi:hypothetical protein MBLNU230_g8381t1 [Neophaeotheca triangularis]
MSSLAPDPDARKTTTPDASLTEHALQKVLDDASPIFGDYVNIQDRYSTWMSKWPDSTPVTQMNIPGTHDSATWNYTLATQQSLNHITELVQPTEHPPEEYRCQDVPIIGALNKGIRAFDMRYAFDVTNTSIVFWHGKGLQSQTATLPDVLFSFYKWLDDHPSEALFLSFKYEGGTTPHATQDESLQRQLFSAFTNPVAHRYTNQAKNELGTLGDTRGKITLLRRFDLDKLPSSYTAALPGLHFSPNDWTVNGANTEITYNESTGGTAHIEDYYHPKTPPKGSPPATAADYIASKVDATVAHLKRAASSEEAGGFFWTFASSTKMDADPPNSPEIQALGDGKEKTPKGGVNQQLLPILREMKGKRLGLVMFDFFEQPGELVDAFLEILEPPGSKPLRQTTIENNAEDELVKDGGPDWPKNAKYSPSTTRKTFPPVATLQNDRFASCLTKKYGSVTDSTGTPSELATETQRHWRF